MVNYKFLGFESFEEYKKHFINMLLPTNKTYGYFVDWDKVRRHINLFSEEISLLNSLIRIPYGSRREYLEKLLNKYPDVIRVIPLIVAERAHKRKIDLFDPETQEFFIIDFDPRKLSANLKKILDFVEFAGVFNLMDEIKDLYDYLLGVEVGLDTNARKNRSGNIFEGMVQDRVEGLLGKDYYVVRNDPHFSLYPKIRKSQKGESKKHDIVIYTEKNEIKPFGIIECNFYNTTGSKPASIAESYIEMNSFAREENIIFIWLTDGPAWKKMKEPLFRSMQEMDWILNFRMIDKVRDILRTGF